jgi:hypothetical protein
MIIKKYTKLVLFLLVFAIAQRSYAFADRSYSLGLGYYSQNVLNRTANKESGETSFFGDTLYPLTFKFDYAFSTSWFIAPQLNFTPLSRKAPADTAQVTLLQLSLLFGKNFESSSSWDWYFGPGILQQTIKGAGGTTLLNNGTSFSTFAVPGRSVDTRKLALIIGSAWTKDRSRWAFDFFIENTFSSSKRAQSMMLSYSYIIGGGRFQ